MSSAGLSRRRAPASSASTQPNDDDAPNPSSASPPSPSPAPTSTNTNDGPSHAGSAFEGGARIAYDPRDLLLSSTESSEIGGAVPRLTLMEEVLLLGIKDKQGYLNIARTQKRLPLPDRPITVLSTRQTGETLLDETLRMMKQTEDAAEKMGVGTWVDLVDVPRATGSRSRREALVVFRTPRRAVRNLALYPSPALFALDGHSQFCAYSDLIFISFCTAFLPGARSAPFCSLHERRLHFGA
ncbi:hypothetical protein B0H16DRAFT_1890382 [Mycena metata]|uniref:Uncharacterized protein n=1 Tax=Mycena metata TaxID=1033252 RepID=A0AAD7IHP9_9AGAR|nr:hypothetical protein B0H16DRAFT_1890382 [Mycena metata]